MARRLRVASGMERSSRSYLFALAGYSTSIIVFPSVQQLADIFDVAVAWVEEITLGIPCSSVIHAVIVPTSARAAAAAPRHHDDRCHALVGRSASQAGRSAARRRLATDINDIHDLLIHSGFESGETPLRRDAVRALLGQVERTLPLLAGVDDAGTRRAVDRDVVGAAGAALATIGTLFLACLLWITSCWGGAGRTG